jgi:hypothetical protein
MFWRIMLLAFYGEGSFVEDVVRVDKLQGIRSLRSL